MAEFKAAFQKMLIHEGGYSNDPDDLGGETYQGIARAMHSNWHGWLLIDKHKNKTGFPSSLDEDAELKKEIDLFYWTNFWFPINADRIQNQSIANSIFDFGVNAGIKTSVRLVQEIIGAEVDGLMGLQTLNRLNSFDYNHFLSAFIVAKITHYIHLVEKYPANKKYLYGWIIRALSFNE